MGTRTNRKSLWCDMKTGLIAGALWRGYSELRVGARRLRCAAAGPGVTSRRVGRFGKGRIELRLTGEWGPRRVAELPVRIRGRSAGSISPPPARTVSRAISRFRSDRGGPHGPARREPVPASASPDPEEGTPAAARTRDAQQVEVERGRDVISAECERIGDGVFGRRSETRGPSRPVRGRGDSWDQPGSFGLACRDVQDEVHARMARLGYRWE